MRKGFTLVELMIVIAIIAIIAAIAIPNLLSGRISANETSAIGTLKQFTSTQAIWLQQGPDGNGMKDYWTYDVSCLHRCYRADDASKVAYIPMDVARADLRPAAPAGGDLFGGRPEVESWDTSATSLPFITQSKSGYWFTVLDYNNISTATDPSPSLYTANYIGNGTTLATNSNQYGFLAFPDAYATSGVRIFIVNEAGTIYAVDPGAANEVGPPIGSVATPAAPGDTVATTVLRCVTDEVPDTLVWPTKNPPDVKHFGSGYNWGVAE